MPVRLLNIYRFYVLDVSPTPAAAAQVHIEFKTTLFFFMALNPSPVASPSSPYKTFDGHLGAIVMFILAKFRVNPMGGSILIFNFPGKNRHLF